MSRAYGSVLSHVWGYLTASAFFAAGFSSLAPALELGSLGLPLCESNFTPECLYASYLSRPPQCKDSLVGPNLVPFDRHAPRGFAYCQDRRDVVLEVGDGAPGPSEAGGTRAARGIAVFPQREGADGGGNAELGFSSRPRRHREADSGC